MCFSLCIVARVVFDHKTKVCVSPHIAAMKSDFQSFSHRNAIQLLLLMNSLSPAEPVAKEVVCRQFDGLLRCHQGQVHCCTCRERHSV